MYRLEAKMPCIWGRTHSVTHSLPRTITWSIYPFPMVLQGLDRLILEGLYAVSLCYSLGVFSIY